MAAAEAARRATPAAGGAAAQNELCRQVLVELSRLEVQLPLAELVTYCASLSEWVGPLQQRLLELEANLPADVQWGREFIVPPGAASISDVAGVYALPGSASLEPRSAPLAACT